MKVIMCMPVYNEADGIAEFLSEIVDELSGKIDELIIVDDASSDSTTDVITTVSAINQSSLKIKLFREEENSGHGITTISALRKALESDADVVISIDGDGQFKSSEIDNALKQFMNKKPDVLEGVRTCRNEPTFRKITTLSVRWITILLSRKKVVDGNSPFRIYKRNTLEMLLSATPRETLIPNIHFTVYSRTFRFTILTHPMTSIQRRGESSTGSTWQPKRAWFPSRRFIKFCLKALNEVIKLSLKRR